MSLLPVTGTPWSMITVTFGAISTFVGGIAKRFARREES